MAKARAQKPARGSFAARLTKARAAAGWTLEEMAGWLGVPRRTLQNWELGTRVPDAFKEGAVLQRLKEI